MGIDTGILIKTFESAPSEFKGLGLVPLETGDFGGYLYLGEYRNIFLCQFREDLRKLKWEYPEDVQIFIYGQQDFMLREVSLISSEEEWERAHYNERPHDADEEIWGEFRKEEVD